MAKLVLFMKARNRGNLVAVKKPVTRSGKTFPQTVWVKPEEAAAMQGRGRRPEMANGNGNQSARQTGYAGTVADGDTVTFDRMGVSHTGIVQSKGKSGVTVQSAGMIHQVPWGSIKSVDKKTNENDAIRMLMDKDAIKGGWRGGTKGFQPPSCDTIDGLLKAAQAARGDLDSFSDAYAERFRHMSPMLVKRPTLKDPERIKEKLRADNKKKGDCFEPPDTYHARTIRDTDGHTFVVNSIAEVGKMLSVFDKDKRVIRIKNNFAEPSDLGYSDINMNVRLPNGTIAEVQLNTTANLVAKERYGHSLYEVWRTIHDTEQEKNHGELLSLMEEGQRALYSLSNRDSKAGTYKLSPKVARAIENGDTTAIFGEEHKEYADAILPFVEKAIPLLGKAAKAGLFPAEKDGKENKTIRHFKELAGRLQTA